MNLIFLIQLTETDKRIIIALCLVLILVFVLIGLLGSLIIRTMKWQGKKCDTLVSDVVTHKIITNSKQLKKYARKKNSRYFLKQAWIPVLFMVIAGLIYVIHNAVIKDWSYNPFNIETGFGSLFFVNKIVLGVFGILSISVVSLIIITSFFKSLIFLSSLDCPF